ncbi:MAG: OmpA family protein [Stenotrophobium sp.]
MDREHQGKKHIAGLRIVAALLLAVSFIGTAMADEVDRGWYVGLDGFYNNLRTGNGSVTQSATTPGTPGVLGTPGSNCVIVGGLLNQLLGTVSLGPAGIPLCLIGPGAGAGIGGTPGASVSQSASVSFKGGEGGGVNVGYAFENGLRPEINLTYAKNDIKTITLGSVSSSSSASLDAARIMGNLWYDLGAGNRVVPYLGGGVGEQHSRYSNSGFDASDNTFTWQVGAGINFWLTNSAALSLDYRYVDAKPPKFGPDANNTTLKTRYHADQIGLGLKYFFGSGAKPPPAPVAPPAEVVPAPPAAPPVALKCPNTPAGIPVGADGCPLDSDGDGVPDYLDECPHTPKGAKVLPNGCALTGDCRTPKPGEAVDANGCAASHNFILKGVNFDFDSNRLTLEAKEILNQVAETLKAYPEVNVDVEGHTDYIGSDAYNMGLSERRADAVKDYLAAQGVNAGHMTPVGYGKTRPIASNLTEEGRAENRRVELHVKD